MAEPEPSSFLLQMRAIGERVSQACQRVEDTKSPHLQYQEQVTALKDEDEQKWARIPPNPTKQDLKAVRQNTLRLGGQLRELELRHAATIEEDDKAYRASLEAQLKKLCRDMVDIFGRSLVIEALQEYPAELVLGSQSPGGGPPNPTEATSQENIQSAYQRNAIDPPPNTEFQDVSMQEPNSIQDHATPTNPSVPNDAPLPVNPKKRNGPIVSGHQKRIRTAEAERVIDFTEIFQDGNAAIKHTIVSFNDEWYILWCEEHGLSFKDNPIMSAAKHLNGRAHGYQPKEFDVAIKHLGVRVRNCNKRLAEENNRVSQEAYRKGFEPPKLNKLDKSKTSVSIHVSSPLEETGQQVAKPLGKRGSTVVNGRGKSGRRPRKEFDGIVDPIPGGIYLGYWPKSKEWQAVLVLPKVTTENPIDIGFPDTIRDLGLTEQIPQCYTYDAQTGILDWQDNYKDGGSLVTKRQFPVMYFDGLEFPSRSSVGWMAANNLQPVDTQDSSFELVPHFKSVREFLETRRRRQAENSHLGNTEQTELRSDPAKIHTLDSIVAVAEALPTEQRQEKQPNTHPDLRQNNCQSDGQEVSVPSEESHLIREAGLSPNRADHHNPGAKPKTRHEKQRPHALATGTGFSSNAASAATTTDFTASASSELVISPSMSSSAHPATVPAPHNHGEHRDSPRTSRLLQKAIDGLRLTAQFDQDGPPMEESQTRLAENRQRYIQLNQVPNALVSCQFQAPSPEKVGAPLTDASHAVQQHNSNDRRLERHQCISNGPTSFNKNHSLSSNVASTSGRNPRAGPPQGPRSSPPYEQSFIPRDANSGPTSVTTTYQLPSFNPMPPNQTTPQTFPGSQVTSNTPSMSHQELISSPDNQPVTLAPISIFNMPTKPSLAPQSVRK